MNEFSEVDIIKFYVPDFDEGHKGNYKSPFSDKDDKPSLNFYRQNGKMLFKSHNTGHQGDVFQFVADLKGLDSKTNFVEVLDAIRADLGAKEQAKKGTIKLSFDKQQTELHAYFKGFGVSPETLDRYGVKQIKYHEFVTTKGKVCKFDYKKPQKLAVCYTIGKRIKVYFPYIDSVQEKGFGFKDQTKADIFGLAQLETPKEIFVAAGEKDCLVLNQNGFPSISFQSENTTPTPAQISQLQGLTSSIFIVYDNDDAGRAAAQKLAKLTNWQAIDLPQGFKDTALFFQKHTADDFRALIPSSPQKVEAPQADKELYTIFHQAEDYLQKHFDFRYNTISLDIEYSPKKQNRYVVLNENQLFVTINKAGVKISMDKLICILKSDFVPHYNPLTSYFQQLPKWDGLDHIYFLASHLHTEQPAQLQAQFEKWLVRCVRSTMEPSYYNKQAFIIVHSRQNSGKTSFCRFLCPPALSQYIAENISDDKDSRISLVKNFLINLDELSSLARHEINSLKALFSKDCINERLPYDRKNSVIPRTANFIGSTNMAEFLTDETGSVRWLCFEISNIDWAYRQKVEIDKVWAQAYALYLSGFHADMTTAEVDENEARNQKFQQRSAEAELIPTLLQPAEPTNALAVFMTATDVLQYLQVWSSLRLNKVMIGRAMPLCGFHRVKDSKTDRYGYWAIQLKTPASL